MKKFHKLLLIIPALLITACSTPATEKTELSPSIAPIETGEKMVKETDSDKMMKEDEVMEEKAMIEYSHMANLVDVTDGNILLSGARTNEATSGEAKMVFDGEYKMVATFNEIPDPGPDHFYEGWIVIPSSRFISTGKVEQVDGVYTNTFSSPEDMTEYTKYVLTLEPDDNDPAPAEHIVDGDFVAIQ